MKKLSGRLLDDKLLYVKSRYSKAGQLPNPRGSIDKRFILQNKYTISQFPKIYIKV